jgi:hypothetical protein
MKKLAVSVLLIGVIMLSACGPEQAATTIVQTEEITTTVTHISTATETVTTTVTPKLTDTINDYYAAVQILENMP